jgi:hypothetical protein
VVLVASAFALPITDGQARRAFTEKLDGHQRSRAVDTPMGSESMALVTAPAGDGPHSSAGARRIANLPTGRDYGEDVGEPLAWRLTGTFGGSR